MTEHTHVENVTSSRGAQWAGAGSLIALAAQALTGGGVGLGGILGGGCANRTAVAEGIIAAKDAQIAKLESERYTDQQVLANRDRLYTLNEKVIGEIIGIDKRVAALETAGPLREQLVNQKIDCCCTQMNAGLNALSQTVAQITKLVVPNSSICPGWGDTTVTITPAATTTATT